MIRLFLVDDHALLRHGLRALFSQEDSFAVVGEAEDGEQLLAQLPTTPCDVVLLDLHMPGLDGLATTQRLRAEYPDVRILVLSMVDNEWSIGQVLAAGAHGYVLKNAGHDEIIVAVRAVAAGRRFLCSDLGLAMLEKVLAGNPEPTTKAKNVLSAREQEILQLVADGLTTAQIAEKLYTSPRTVETHRQNIMEKTGAKNTAALIKTAASQGWLS
ncbi:response regulator [Hymenobacter properus]|uniref:Response regulator transcription factor n=1 Tax=Hymenobacter properus TaxID=2791026 RepID=A0A931BKQ4_9BACT|nr:response regulator transcription factor [Hymenobacter properus]MBF9144077.1 response regulator transcription factor [Hymenobacter properus]MBR7722893.1 response regulator transcription factor [Microvirga sp. SRT04]